MVGFIHSEIGTASGEVRYNLAEKSFDFAPRKNSDISLVINYIYLGIDSREMCINELWGFSPKEGWITQTLTPPDCIAGAVKLIGDFEPGKSYRYNRNDIWQVFFDQSSGWVCIGDSIISVQDKAITLANNACITISNGQCKSIWIKPVFF